MRFPRLLIELRIDRLRCELLLFPERLRINHARKVSTPKISPVYRYETTKKTLVGASDSSYDDPYRKKLAPILSELKRWHILLDKQYERYGGAKR